MIVVLVCLVVLAGAIAYIAVPAALLGGTVTADPMGFWIAVLVAGVAGLLLIAELRPRRRQVFEASIEGATVAYPISSVRELVEKEAKLTPGVRHAHGEVESHRGAVDLRMTVETEPGYDAQEMASKTTARVREKLERGLGLRVDKLRMTVRPGQQGPSLPWKKKPAVATTVEEEGERTPPVEDRTREPEYSSRT